MPAALLSEALAVRQGVMSKHMHMHTHPQERTEASFMSTPARLETIKTLIAVAWQFHLHSLCVHNK